MSSKKQPLRQVEIVREGDPQVVEITVNLSDQKKDPSLLAALLKAGIDIDHSCGGMGTCGTCRVEVFEGLSEFGPRNEVEIEIAHDRDFSETERLCCQTNANALNRVRIKLPKKSNEGPF